MVVVLADPSADHARITDAGSRVIQGILTGIGFLGAGVIVHAQHHFRVRRLTSAACTWFAACVGIACGIGQWPIVAIALAIAFTLLIAGRRVEHWLHRTLRRSNHPAHKPAATASPPDAPPS